MTAKEGTMRWAIEDLRPFPKQKEFFSDCNYQELMALEADMEKFGQRVPIEITPEGEIVDGHQRVAVAKLFGWAEIDAIIVEGTDEEIEWRFLSANATRRQLTPLQRARCAARMLDLEKGPRKRAGDQERRRDRLQKRVGKLLGLSDREIRRLLRVLDTPPEVQQAYDAGKLSIDLAGKVAGLPAEVQNEIATQLREKGSRREKAIVGKYLGATPKQSEPMTVGKAYRELLKGLNKWLSILQTDVDSISIHDGRTANDLAILEQAQELVPRLIERVQQAQEAHLEHRRRMDESIAELQCSIGKGEL